jgi:hypothetical protein
LDIVPGLQDELDRHILVLRTLASKRIKQVISALMDMSGDQVRELREEPRGGDQPGCEVTTWKNPYLEGRNLFLLTLVIHILHTAESSRH